jgi:hypothetical protein
MFLDMLELLANPFLMDAVVCWKPSSSSELGFVWEGGFELRSAALPVDPMFIRDVMFVSVLMNYLGN